MLQYICHYIRDLCKEKPLTLTELERIGSEHSTIRISWGGEYFDFSFDKQNTFHPIEGKSNLLTGQLPRVFIKPYSCQDILMLIKDADQLIAFSNKDKLEFTPHAEYIGSGACDSSIHPNLDLFQTVKIYKYIDYDILLFDLEDKGFLSTRHSQNLIATIDKKFQLSPKAVERVPLLKDYSDHFYEADCLGTKLHEELTTLMQNLWYSTDFLYPSSEKNRQVT
uniref:Uncharacterized protein n=1 Tax=Marseillevirus LCMAC101 TaxID=2506602 RepID=A0A481YQP9_9VIRU|nr:MAG: hypothetical protein LCMAC101_00950 [Marseillevirus LCMAC101]